MAQATGRVDTSAAQITMRPSATCWIERRAVRIGGTLHDYAAEHISRQTRQPQHKWILGSNSE